MNWTEFAPKDLPRPAGGHTRFLLKARPPRPSEPILIPKLRIQFADFPYLHYSIDQRLLTLETCCGYGYELMRLRCNPQPDFQGSTRHSWTQRELLRSLPSQNPFSPRRNSRASAAYAEKTTLPRARVDVSGSFHVAMLIRGSNSSAIRLRNKDLIPFRPKLWSLQIENTTQFYRVSPKP